MNGKGDVPRVCDKAMYDVNYDHIFKKYVMDDIEDYDLTDAEPVLIGYGQLCIPYFTGWSHEN